MGILLYKHNDQAYKAALSMLKETGIDGVRRISQGRRSPLAAGRTALFETVP